MRRQFAILQSRQPDVVTLAAGTWLASGIVLLGLTPLPLRSPVWGWSPAFWLVLAPAVLLLTKRFVSRWSLIVAPSAARPHVDR